jgi:predicted Fe-S protein YdhL (DUF1289 family)
MSPTPVNPSNRSSSQSDSPLSNLEPIPVRSPCISLCVLNVEGMCAGCFRTGDEIGLWSAYSNDERREVLKLAYDREKEVNPFL